MPKICKMYVYYTYIIHMSSYISGTTCFNIYIYIYIHYIYIIYIYIIYTLYIYIHYIYIILYIYIIFCIYNVHIYIYTVCTNHNDYVKLGIIQVWEFPQSSGSRQGLPGIAVGIHHSVGEKNHHPQQLT